MIYENILIEKAVYGGYGLAFADGKALFVEGVIPGETVDARVTRDTASHSFAAATEIRTPSPHRIAPECPSFGACGGCDYLYADYDTELAMKREIILDALARIGKFRADTIPAIGTQSSERFGYRSHAEVKLDNRGRAGFYRKESNDVVPFPPAGCLLLWKPLVEGIRAREGSTGKGFRIAAGADMAPRSSLEGSPVIAEQEGDIVLERDIRCFYQANRLLRGAMRETVARYASLAEDDNFIDGACGVGFFALDLARRAASGTGYDIERESVRWARHNAKKNGIDNVKFEARDLSKLDLTGGTYGAVVVDPPRAGLPKKARRGITFLEPRAIVYVSCNPATFARDAADFAAAGYAAPGTHLHRHVSRDTAHRAHRALLAGVSGFPAYLPLLPHPAQTTGSPATTRDTTQHSFFDWRRCTFACISSEGILQNAGRFLSGGHSGHDGGRHSALEGLYILQVG